MCESTIILYAAIFRLQTYSRIIQRMVTVLRTNFGIPFFLDTAAYSTRGRLSHLDNRQHSTNGSTGRGQPQPGGMKALLVVLISGLLFVLQDARVAAQITDALGFEARTYDGTYNNLQRPLWGSVNTTQVGFYRNMI